MERDSNNLKVQQEYRKGVVFAVIIFVLIVVGMFIFAYLQKNEQKNIANINNEEETEFTDPYSDITRVSGTHYFIDGVHTIVGEIPMPTPCDLLEADMIVAESYPEQITLDFTVINNAESCAQMITPARFMVSAPASASSTFTARFMDRPIELNLIPAPPGETPEDFEIFIKG